MPIPSPDFIPVPVRETVALRAAHLPTGELMDLHHPQPRPLFSDREGASSLGSAIPPVLAGKGTVHDTPHARDCGTERGPLSGSATLSRPDGIPADLRPGNQHLS